MTDADRLEWIQRRYKMEVAEGNCAGSYSWDPEGWYRPQGHDLDLAVEDIGFLLAEVERLRGVVGAELQWHLPRLEGFRGRPVCPACTEIDTDSRDAWGCSAARRLVAALEEGG
ncbi:MAG: hypothetical protein ACYDD0_00855 [Candidatus Dormibacteria bacterium]